MNQKPKKPTLTGQRIKVRKRDEKERYDPSGFRDVIVQGLNEAGTDLAQVAKFLDTQGHKLDYRRYAEPLFDILIAGGILAPGGTLVEDGDKTKVSRSDVCLFAVDEDVPTIQNYSHQVFVKVTRRYKYLEKLLEDEMKKILMFLKGFSESERNKVAMLTAIFLTNGLIPATCLASLFQEHLVKEGISVEFAIVLFRTWFMEKDMNSIASTLRKAEMEGKLMDFLPVNKRTDENFASHFEAAGLQQLVRYQRNLLQTNIKNNMVDEISEYIQNEKPLKEIEANVSEIMVKNSIPEHDVVKLLWKCVMSAQEWSKKDDQVIEQVTKHLKIYAPLFAAFATQGKSEISLILKIQEYCFDNMHLMKTFSKIVMLLYQRDVLSEDVILKWYHELHLSKGKSIFLKQMVKMVEWLENAEEEDSEEEESEEEK
ncbi:basic leucine zipper and W2 domain-containing protein 1-like [Anneissia japonica]|uniref:basic leucine zipper and W2 domain-containing protein 1-like n=1 Tax=Anneissia japonica TaxID=1529436 RepID=UPI00142586AD|nr:basic leucine zipper and W2 domain-containing protein 1-like [Anneissia japonica]